LFSALEGVPFIAIERSGKIADLCWDLNWAARMTSEQVDAARIAGEADRLLAAGPAVREQLNRSVELMRKRAHRNLASLDALTAERTSDLSFMVRRIRAAMSSTK